MSSAKPDSSGAGDGDRRSSRLKRFLKRASSIFSRGKSSQRQSAGDAAPNVAAKGDGEGSSIPPTAPTTHATATGGESTSESFEQKKALDYVQQKEYTTHDDETKTGTTPSLPPPANPPTSSQKHPITAADSHHAQIEKARLLFAKYNMTLSDSEWTPPFRGDYPRVEKKVRMRIRRYCHRCETTFGAEKLCKQCGHTRCKKCPKTSTSSASASRSVDRDGKGKIIRRSIVNTGEAIIVDDANRALAPISDPLAGPSQRDMRLKIDPDKAWDVSAQAKAA